MRLIDADALKSLPFHRLIHTDFGETAVSFEEIDTAPTVEIPTELCKGCRFLKDCETCEEKLRPQGEWQHWGSPFSDEGVVNSCVCTLCGARFVEIPDEVFNFCPNCGADMRGEEK